MINGILKVLKSKQCYPFVMSKSVSDLNKLTMSKLPVDDVYKFISVSGGFSSVSFIKLVAEKEKILELTASTLRIGEKQFNYLSDLNKKGKLDKATFFIGSIMKSDKNHNKGKYDYYTKFVNVCEENKWKTIVVNNHSKIILMRTDKNYYVLETSSNLNENPKIEQFSFENNKELYDFYYKFFEMVKETKG